MRISGKESVQVALSAVWTNRFRSMLTILGIVIGITTVVTVSSLLTGLRKGVITFFEEFGPDNIFISQFSGDPNGRPGPKEAKRRPISPDYAEILKRLAPSIEETSVAMFIPQVIGRQALVAKVPGFESDSVSMMGLSASGWLTQPKNLTAGRVFTAEEDARSARVAVIGPKLAEALFPGAQALGQTVNVGGADYVVIGITEEAKGGFFGENALDRMVTVPLQTARLRYPGMIDRFQLTAKARQGQKLDAFEEVRAVMRRARKLPTEKPDDFVISTADQIVARFEGITAMIVLVSTALSGLGLLVGGIGVMNIMLVSVTERTREIGVRKALGARKQDIIFQFLMEAVALTSLGGILGIIISVTITLIIGKLVTSLPSEVPPFALALGFGVSVAVGLFFGVWPAYKAAQLDPVEALRYE